MVTWDSTGLIATHIVYQIFSVLGRFTPHDIHCQIDYYIAIQRGVAQLVEHRSPKPKVAGSIPVSPAIFR